MDGKHYDREVAGVEGVGGHEGGSGLGKGGHRTFMDKH